MVCWVVVAACDVGFYAKARLPEEISRGEAGVGGHGPRPNVLACEFAELAHGLVVPVPSVVRAKKTNPQRMPMLGPTDRAEACCFIVQSQIIEIDSMTRSEG